MVIGSHGTKWGPILQRSTPQRSTSVSAADEAEICGEGLDGLKKKKNAEIRPKKAPNPLTDPWEWYICHTF